MNPSINNSKIILDNQDNKIISQEEAEEAVKTLLQYIGEDPERVLNVGGKRVSDFEKYKKGKFNSIRWY